MLLHGPLARVLQARCIAAHNPNVRSVTVRQAPEEFGTTALAAAGVELKDMAKVSACVRLGSCNLEMECVV